MKPLVIDLYCGLGGWSEGFLANGYECRGYDIEAHDYGSGGYPGELILRDVRSIHGSEFKDATCIVGSSPCQEFSYRAMPWKRAKALPPPYLGIELFNAQFRIQREASEAAGHHIPMVAENVRGAQKWVGRAQWHFGSFYLWGDVPALMPPIPGAKLKTTGPADERQAADYNCHINEMRDAFKVPGFRFDGSGRSFQSASVEGEARKGMGIGSVSWHQGKGHSSPNDPRNFYSTSPKRKAASAQIAKIPFPLADWIAKCFLP